MNTAVAPSEEAEPSIEMHERLPADLDIRHAAQVLYTDPSRPGAGGTLSRSDQQDRLCRAAVCLALARTLPA